MESDPIVIELAEDLRTRHGCHTVILYGSRAGGDARPESDYDLAGFGAAKATYRDARTLRGRYVDAFVHPEAKLLDPPRDLLHVRGGVVLFEKDGAGARFLAALEEMFKAGPERLPDDEIAALRVWAWKMLDRAAASDTEGDYRRAWLLMALLEDYFALRHRWYLGPKRGFQWLAANEPAVHAAFAEALRPGVDPAAIERLVAMVAGPRP
jgi:predicted nucleotidyltransferase